jgi:hypothetical protein
MFIDYQTHKVAASPFAPEPHITGMQKNDIQRFCVRNAEVPAEERCVSPATYLLPSMQSTEIEM